MFGLARVRGTFAVTRGELTVAEPAEQSSVTAEVSSASFSTRNFMRDPQVRSRLFLDAGRHPAVAFRSARVQRSGSAWTVDGVLTVKGRPVPFELTVTDVTADGTALVFRATQWAAGRGSSPERLAGHAAAAPSSTCETSASPTGGMRQRRLGRRRAR
jgi:polyisoprenoid-binding protein YceI